MKRSGQVTSSQITEQATWVCLRRNLTWVQTWKLTFQGHLVRLPSRLDEKNTMVPYPLLYRFPWISYIPKTMSTKSKNFDGLWWPQCWPHIEITLRKMAVLLAFSRQVLLLWDLLSSCDMGVGGGGGGGGQTRKLPQPASNSANPLQTTMIAKCTTK